MKEVLKMATSNNNQNQETKEVKVVKLNNFISYELLRKMKEKEPNTKFILPNGKEAVLNDKKEQPNK